MRDKEVFDSELRLVAAVRRSIREQGGHPSSRQVDEMARRTQRAGRKLTVLPGVRHNHGTACTSPRGLQRISTV